MLPFGSTILEIGSGNSTKILSHFYKMISIESNIEWMNKYNKPPINSIIQKYINDNFNIQVIGAFPSVTIIRK